MRYTGFLEILLTRGHSRKWVRAFTLMELLVTVAIISTLAAIGVPSYNGYVDRARSATAAADIRDIELGITRFLAENGAPPANLAAAGFPNLLDPWGRPYQYLWLQGVPPAALGGAWRRDRFLNPLNTDYDLYSMGKDGATVAPLTGGPAHDDIVRANNGRFVGLATDY
jgi:general secretion pathway protein G